MRKLRPDVLCEFGADPIHTLLGKIQATGEVFLDIGVCTSHETVGDFLGHLGALSQLLINPLVFKS